MNFVADNPGPTPFHCHQPSALVLFAFALLVLRMQGPTLTAVLHGLQLVAVAVVAQAVWSMAQKLCPDRRQATLALTAVTLMLVAGDVGVQILALVVEAVGGVLLCQDLPMLPALPSMPVSFRLGGIALVLFLALPVALPVAGRASPHSLLALAGIFYKSGALGSRLNQIHQVTIAARATAAA